MKQAARGWSPYIAGGLSGALSVLSVFVAGKFLGASTSFVRFAGMVERTIAPHLVDTAYYMKYTLAIDWQFMFVLGIVLGAFFSSRTDGSFALQAVPDMWAERFGSNRIIRFLAAFGGGMLAIYGARMAGGCPSGHGLSGLSQLSVSGFVAASCFFVGGMLSANSLYRRRL